MQVVNIVKVTLLS